VAGSCASTFSEHQWDKEEDRHANPTIGVAVLLQTQYR